MPDAHVGYGLPIGGVLATKNEVIPYGVGMDIGCRMALSIFDLPVDFAQRNKFLLKTVLKKIRTQMRLCFLLRLVRVEAREWRMFFGHIINSLYQLS